MSPEPPRENHDRAAAQQRFLSLFLRSEREVFRYVAALVPNVADAEDIVQQTAVALWEKFDAYDPAQPFTPSKTCMIQPEIRLPATPLIATPVMKRATTRPRRAAGYHCVK